MIGSRTRWRDRCKGPRVTPFEMHPIRRWYGVDFLDVLQSIPAWWLPRLPEEASF